MTSNFATKIAKVKTALENVFLKKNLGSTNGGKNLVTDSSGNIVVENKPTIPSASSTTPNADVTGGAIGSATTWAKADHQHPLSTAYATASHTHSEYVTDEEYKNNELSVFIPNLTETTTVFNDRYVKADGVKFTYTITGNNPQAKIYFFDENYSDVGTMLQIDGNDMLIWEGLNGDQWNISNIFSNNATSVDIEYVYPITTPQDNYEYGTYVDYEYIIRIDGVDHPFVGEYMVGTYDSDENEDTPKITNRNLLLKITRESGCTITNLEYTKILDVSTNDVIETKALSNIGTSSNTNQHLINKAIDTAIADKQNTLVSGTNIKTINNTSLLGSGDITITGGSSSNVGTFTELASLISSASSGDTIVLDKDYKNSGSESAIDIQNKSLTIIGNGHTIDANSSSGIFYLMGQSEITITFSSINFINAIQSSSRYGGAIGIYAPNQLLNRHNCNIYDCTFSNNSATNGGGIFAHISSNTYNISNCIFINNTATSNGGGIYSSGSSLTTYNCTFISSTLYYATNKNYLTDHQSITGKEDNTNKVTSWSSTTTDTHYPSEKLVKDSLDSINTQIGTAITLINGNGGNS